MRGLINFLLDLIFPKFCLGCGQEGLWLCKKCYENIKTKNHQCCPICRRQNQYGSVCDNCKNKTSLDGLITGCVYEKGLIKKCIHYYKYQFIKDLSRPLSSLMLKTYKKLSPPALKKAIMIPIPLHRKRFIERGYNQSEILGKHIAKKINMPYYDKLLKRVKYTQKQASLDKKSRLINLNQAFKVNKKFDFKGKNVIIIDDVATTLATLNSSAKQLKKAGANEVWGLVIARGNFKS